MNAKERILKALGKSRARTGADMARGLGITRQAVNLQLRQLVQDGVVQKTGATRGCTYRIAQAKGQSSAAFSFLRQYRTKQLEEDKVFEEVAILLQLNRRMSPPAFEVLQYAFTEMLNNAIEHSRSPGVQVECKLGPYDCTFRIRDHGVGVFHSITTKFRLESEQAAVAELLKGKTTTMQEKHTGEGIFFTSKACDRFSLRSHETELVVDRAASDTFLAKTRRLGGTEVNASVKRRARRKLSELFSEYAPEEFGYQFDRTRVLVRLFRDTYVSRSEAKRLLAGLHRFREVLLDFAGVRSIGQGFADEVFRVFQSAHPDIVIKTENLDPALRPMTHHVLDNHKY